MPKKSRDRRRQPRTSKQIPLSLKDADPGIPELIDAKKDDKPYKTFVEGNRAVFDLGKKGGFSDSNQKNVRGYVLWSSSNPLNEETLKENFKNNANLLIIAERPNIYIIHYRGAVDFAFANQNIDKIKNNYIKEFDHILVLQKIDDKTQTPLQWNAIEPDYRLKKLSDIKLTQSTYIKISEIID